MGTDRVGTDTVSGRRIGRRYRCLYLIFLAALISWTLISARLSVGAPALYLLVYGASWFRPATEVSAAGIRCAGWRKRIISWDDIEAIAAPKSYATSVSVLLRDQSTVTLADLQAAESERVATIGGKELRPIPRTPPRPVTPAPKPPPSSKEIERDLARRAAALAADAERMSNELERIRRKART